MSYKNSKNKTFIATILFCFSFTGMPNIARSGSVLSRLSAQDTAPDLPTEVIESILSKLNPSPSYLIKLRELNTAFKLASERLMVRQLRRTIGEVEFKKTIDSDEYNETEHHDIAVKYFMKLAAVSKNPQKKGRTTPTIIKPSSDLALFSHLADEYNVTSDIIFSPEDPNQFLTTHHSLNGYEVFLWNISNRSNKHILSLPESIKDVFFLKNLSERLLLIITNGNNFVLIDPSDQTQEDPILTSYSSQLIKTGTFREGGFQFLLFNNKISIWKDYDFNQNYEIPLTNGTIGKIRQDPNNPNNFLLINDNTCQTSTLSLNEKSYTLKQINHHACDAVYLAQEPGRAIIAGMKEYYDRNRIKHHRYLSKIDLESFQEIDRVLLNSDQRINEIFLNPLDTTTIFILAHGRYNPVSLYDGLSLEKIAPKKENSIKELISDFFIGGEYNFPNILFSGVTEDSKIILWKGIPKAAQGLDIYSASSGEFLRTIKPKIASFFSNPSKIAPLGFNTELLILQEGDTLSLIDPMTAKTAATLHKDSIIHTYAQNPYFPHIIVASGANTYIWDFFKVARKELKQSK